MMVVHNVNVPNATKMYTYRGLNWSILRYAYFTTAQKKAWSIDATAWMNLENIMQSERSETQKLHIFSFHVHKVCPEGIQPCDMRNRGIYCRRYKIQETLYIGQ